ARHLSLAQRHEELGGGHEGRDVDVGATDLDRSTRIAPHAAGKSVRSCELQREDVARRRDLASVEHLDDVELRRDALERRAAQMPAAVAAERMRDVREAALLVDKVDAAIGAEPRRHLVLEVEADELAAGGRDLFAGDPLNA